MAHYLLIPYLLLVLIRPHEMVAGLEDIPVAFTLLATVFLVWVSVNKIHLETPQPFLITAFILVAFASVLRFGWADTSPTVFTLVPMWILVFMLSVTSGSFRTIHYLLHVLIFCTFVIAIHTLDQAITGVGWSGLPIRPLDERVHYFGPLNDPNDLGGFFVAMLPISFYLMKQKITWGAKIYYTTATILILISIVVTDSRGAMIAAVAIIALEAWRRYGLLISIMLTAALGVIATINTRLSDIRVAEESAFGRVEAWQAGVQMFFDHPLLGVGLGQFTENHIRTAHNSLVLVLAETGLLGFFFWSSLLFSTFFMLIKFLMMTRQSVNSHFKHNRTQWLKYQNLGWSIFLMLCGYSIVMMFLSRSYDVIFTIILGVAASYCLYLNKYVAHLYSHNIVNFSSRSIINTSATVVALLVIIQFLLRFSE